jgi:hypothetical protein
MSEVDRSSLVFFDFNIPVFTPGRNRVEPTLDLSVAYRHMSSAKVRIISVQIVQCRG